MIWLQSSRTQGGTSLLELLWVLALVSITSALAWPYLQDTQRRWQVRSVSDEFVAMLHLARSEALKRGGNVVVQKLPDGGCGYAAGSGAWSCGWRVFWNADGKSGFQVGGGDTLIQTFSALPGKVAVSFSGGDSYTTFNAWGQPGGLGSLGATFTSQTDPSPWSGVKSICMSSGGRIRVLDASSCSG